MATGASCFATSIAWTRRPRPTSGASRTASSPKAIAPSESSKPKLPAASRTPRQTREGNNASQPIAFCASLVLLVVAAGGPQPGASHALEQDSSTPAARVPAAGAGASAVAERHGDLPPAGP